VSGIRQTIFENLKYSLEDYIADGPPIDIHAVHEYTINVQNEAKAKTPCLIIQDLGQETRQVYDATHERFTTEVLIHGFVQSPDFINETNLLNKAIKEWIDAVPSLGDNVLVCRYSGNDTNSFDGDEKQGITTVRIRITYWCESGSY